MKFLLVYRDERFSPGAVDRDKAMLDKVAQLIADFADSEIKMLHESELQEACAADYADFTVIHMTRSAEAFAKLIEIQSFGAHVLNPPAAIKGCSRANIENAMEANNLPTPKSLVEQHPNLAGKGWWVKANNTADSSPSHIQFFKTLPEELVARVQKHDESLLVQPHIEGLGLKFYGVRGTDFFHVREDVSPTVLQQLKDDANCLADALSLDIYGGDAILTPDGLLTIIDFNDFPSFSSCRELAAEAIKYLVSGI